MENIVGNVSQIIKVKIKDWDFIQAHAGFVNAVPDMKSYCGQIVTITECVVPSISENTPCIYTIFEDNGKYWWSQEWFENIEE